jgi:hypothetical protein
MVKYTKIQMAGYIRSLFAERPETIRATRWACVIKEGKAMVARRLMAMPTDLVVVESVLEPNELPSWFLIYYGVWKNWHRIAEAQVEI